ncbi:hypothetical protein [Streptomyces sp. NPDC059649]|uniref:hypothetical protein n=1 Tax=Streptomyces sp. NPDC059649 TaxID=3346895 RepID=UPI003694C68C
MATENTQPNERDIIKPLDHHQPIIGPNGRRIVGKNDQPVTPGEDIIKPLDHHQPIGKPIGDALGEPK